MTRRLHYSQLAPDWHRKHALLGSREAMIGEQISEQVSA
jgi:hypothetical protein